MRVGVIGGGIQGTCVSLELATRGVEVDLIDASPSLMEGASRHNEGKIHLGFVYANDPTFETAELMARCAGQFHSLMKRWLGIALESVPLSTPFNYAVHKDSLLKADQLEERYRVISQAVRRLVIDADYFGIDNPQHIVRVRDQDHAYGPAIDAIFSTRERAISPGPLADLVIKTVADAEPIRAILDTRIISVDTTARRLAAASADHGSITLGPYDHIVNCAWEGRPALDASAGVHIDRPWTFRMKYFLLAGGEGPMVSLPSTTVVLGPFGDIVDYGLGEHYLSWYPTGRLGWSTELIPPSWPNPPDAATAIDIAQETVRNLASVLPDANVFTPTAARNPVVRGGIVYSLGDTDVHDPQSEFHRRSEVGPRSSHRYHSVDTGKYTTAPLFAMDVANRVCD